MKVIFEADLEEPREAMAAADILRVDSYKIALWDITQLFRQVLKYENILHDGYLTEDEDNVVVELQKRFFDILEEHDLRNNIENQG